MSAEQDQKEPAESTVPPIQFRLRSLLLMMAVCSVALAVMAALGQVATWIIAFALALIVPHLAAAALGHRLKSRSTSRTSRLSQPAPGQNQQPKSRGGGSCRRLGGRRAHWSWLCLAVVGAVAGGLVGWALVPVWIPQILSSQDFVLEVASFAVLGGLVGFLLSSFLHTTLAAINEARHADSSGTTSTNSSLRRSL